MRKTPERTRHFGHAFTHTHHELHGPLISFLNLAATPIWLTGVRVDGYIGECRADDKLIGTLRRAEPAGGPEGWPCWWNRGPAVRFARSFTGREGRRRNWTPA